jgi:peptidoglycan/xylan/chitin deacetylase (PgdA/CDA1 family)
VRRAAALIALLAASSATARDRPVIAFTFDDIPIHSKLPPGETRVGIVKALAETLRRAGVPATGFINAGLADREPGSAAAMAAWRDGGLPLGNHTWTHANLDTVGVEAFREEIAHNEPVLEALMGRRDWRWFRYPFLNEGKEPGTRDAIRAHLATRGYRIAGVTMSFGDFMFNDPYARCATAGDRAALARLETTFLDAAAETAVATRAAAKARYGRDIPYVLLMHAGALDATMLPRLIAAYRKAGFRFVSLDEAERDPAFTAYADPKNPGAPTPLALPQTALDLSWLATVCR